MRYILSKEQFKSTPPIIAPSISILFIIKLANSIHLIVEFSPSVIVNDGPVKFQIEDIRVANILPIQEVYPTAELSKYKKSLIFFLSSSDNSLGI